MMSVTFEANSMSTSQKAPSKRESLNIRIKSEERGLIDRAARARGKTRTDFILDAARLAAEDDDGADCREEEEARTEE